MSEHPIDEWWICDDCGCVYTASVPKCGKKECGGHVTHLVPAGPFSAEEIVIVLTHAANLVDLLQDAWWVKAAKALDGLRFAADMAHAYPDHDRVGRINA